MPPMYHFEKILSVLEHLYLSFINKMQLSESPIEKRATEPLLSHPRIVEKRDCACEISQLQTVE